MSTSQGQSVQRSGTFWPVTVDPAGATGPTRRAARGPRWRASSRGRYVPAGVERTTDQRIVEAAATLPEDGAITGWASLRWRGARWFDGYGVGGLPRAVMRASAAVDVRGQPGMAICAERLSPLDLEVVDGIVLTSAVRSVWFEMRHAETLAQAVTALDMAAYDDLVSIDELAVFAGEHPAWIGAPQCRKAVALAHENAWSPTEVSLRLICQIHGQLDGLLCNRPLFDPAGRHIGTPDLLDPAAGVAIEYDGATHLTTARRSTDLAREAEFRRHGLEYVTAVSCDLAQPWRWLPRLHEARRRALAARGPRNWTLQPPHWWIATDSVAARRALSTAERERLLGYRAA
jgi:hypothetical protein